MLIHPERWQSLPERFREERPRRLLALDGGGIRGLIALGILESLERVVSERTGLKLCDYFDYIAGTSTGSIIAAGLARGMQVAEIIEFYKSCGKQMFEHAVLVQRLKNFYTADPLKQKLQVFLGADTTLASKSLRCLLLLVTKNATTDSPWPISNNPDARYNDPSRQDCNLQIPLWQLVRASTAAPVYFPPEILQWDPHDKSKTFVFVDGGVTPHNNPAFLLYRMATNPAYRLNWQTGEKNLLLVSVGTGAAESMGATASAPNRNIVSTITGLSGALMYAIQVEQDINCRTIGRCTYGSRLDREMHDMVPREVGSDITSPVIPLTTDLGRHFLYARYNADLSAQGLKTAGFHDVVPSSIQKMDGVENMDKLLQIGRKAGEVVDPRHLGPFL
ncbi:MAG TPA: patatin-like phospholipase family protein [Acidobacteriaceae bacterium]|nr:patatin-like phospholipase family protein [Acidobacteriaceae bacterium]